MVSFFLTGPTAGFYVIILFVTIVMALDWSLVGRSDTPSIQVVLDVFGSAELTTHPAGFLSVR